MVTILQRYTISPSPFAFPIRPAMNISRDPVLRRRMMTMVEEIYDKCVIPPSKANSGQLTITEKKAIDRCVIKYLETAKYVQEAFHQALALIAEQDKNSD